MNLLNLIYVWTTKKFHQLNKAWDGRQQHWQEHVLSADILQQDLSLCLACPPKTSKYNKVLFNSEKFLDFSTVPFSFLFDKYYPIMD